jgi:hypothetical protein
MVSRKTPWSPEQTSRISQCRLIQIRSKERPSFSFHPISIESRNMANNHFHYPECNRGIWQGKQPNSFSADDFRFNNSLNGPVSFTLSLLFAFLFLFMKQMHFFIVNPISALTQILHSKQEVKHKGLLEGHGLQICFYFFFFIKVQYIVC